MADEQGEKTEQPTDRRRQEVRERGTVVRSLDLSVAGLMLATAGGLQFLGPEAVQSLVALMRGVLGGTAWTTVDRPALFATFREIGWHVIPAVVPLLGLLWVAALAVNYGQVGFQIHPEAIQPNPSRINPLESWQRIWSLTSVAKLVASLLKLTILVAIAGGALYNRLPGLVRATELEVGPLSLDLGQALVRLTYQLAMALICLALLDYGFQFWKHEQDIKMTREELREEMRMMEGDPHTRQRRRDAHQKLATSRQMLAVKTADVVVTNPTEYAVALKYDPEQMSAPTVVAKGTDGLAARIRRVAAESGVPIVEKKPLARALYHGVKVGAAVPVELYEAVAEILAYVYRLSGRRPPVQ